MFRSHVRYFRARTVASTFDIAGRRTRITYPGTPAYYVDRDFLATGEMTHIRENGAASGPGVLATFAYDIRGRRTSLTRGNGTVTNYTHDAASRLSQLALDLNGTANDLTLGFSYNPASQITSNTRSNDSYSWLGAAAATTDSTANGLNQLTQIGAATATHDARGNVTAIGSIGYGYTAENRMHSRSGASYAYDGLGRLYYHGASYTWWDHDGGNLVAEIYHPNNSIQRRWVHGPGVDEPLVQYEGSGTTDRRYLHADERGSIVAVSDSSGTVTAVNRYDEYGAPDAGNSGRFQYAGQPWLAEAGLYYSRARMYHPQLGRFLQTDPIGYGDGMNLYAYVGGDPINGRDPSGLCTERAMVEVKTTDYHNGTVESDVVDKWLEYPGCPIGDGSPAGVGTGDHAGGGAIIVTGTRRRREFDVSQLDAFRPAVLTNGFLGDQGSTLALLQRSVPRVQRPYPRPERRDNPRHRLPGGPQDPSTLETFWNWVCGFLPCARTEQVPDDYWRRSDEERRKQARDP